jgi:hypothetical protein
MDGTVVESMGRNKNGQITGTYKKNFDGQCWTARFFL